LIQPDEVKVVPVTADMALHVASMLRDIDIEELAAMGRLDPIEAALDAYRSSTEKYAITRGGICAAMGGVAPSINPMWGVPWLLGTDDMEHPLVRKQLIIETKPMLNKFLLRYPFLENFVLPSNERVLRWLRWAGFDVGPAEEWEFATEPMCRISKRRV
jgi:hypothetical protein